MMAAVEALVDRVLTEGRTNHAALHDFERNRQGASLELHDEIVDIFGRDAFDLTTVGDCTVDLRRRDDRLVDDDRHRLADMCAREFVEGVRRAALQLEANYDLSKGAGRAVCVFEIRAADDGLVDRSITRVVG